jgi:hypothetical protein
VLHDLIFKAEARLIGQPPRLPREPRELSPQRQREARTRLRTGEPAYLIAREFDVERSTIDALRGRGAG